MGTQELEWNLAICNKHGQQNVSRRLSPCLASNMGVSRTLVGTSDHAGHTDIVLRPSSAYLLSHFTYPSKAPSSGPHRNAMCRNQVTIAHQSWKHPPCSSNPNLLFHSMLNRFPGGGDLPKPSKGKVRPRSRLS